MWTKFLEHQLHFSFWKVTEGSLGRLPVNFLAIMLMGLTMAFIDLKENGLEGHIISSLWKGETDVVGRS
jgi:hypothetical protein